MKFQKTIETIKKKAKRLFHWLTATRRRKILSGLLAILIFLTSIRIWYWFNPKKVKAATLKLTTTDSAVQIDVENRYRAVLQKGDTTDFILFYDRAQNNTNPNPTHEFRGPCIVETNTYCLRDDENRATTILEASKTRIKVRVEGKFAYEGSSGYLTDGTTNLTVSADYTFTTEGVFVSNTTDFQTGLGLDADSGHNGYEWLGVWADVTDAAFDDTATNYYGDGETEAGISADGEFVNTNHYFWMPGTGSDSYQDAFVGIQRGGWYDDETSGTHEWNWTEGDSGTQDAIAAQEQAYTTSGIHYAKWFFLLLAENDVDSEAEREAYINDFRNPDIPDMTTGSEWDDITTVGAATASASFAPAAASPGLDFDSTDDYITIAADSAIDLNGQSAYTIEAWINPDSDGESNTGNIFRKGDTYLQVDTESSGTVEITANIDLATTDANVNTTDTIPINQWSHIAAVWVDDDDDEVTVYINGASSATSSAGDGSAADDSGSALNFGGNAGATTFDGTIEEMRIWTDERTAAEIQENMFNQVSSTESDLAGYWKLNENTGTSAADETSNGNDGTLTDGPIWVTGYVPDHYNRAEGAYTIDASGDQIEIDISGDTYTRNSPNFKISNYRNINPPDEAVLEDDRLQKDYDYIANVKPISDAYFADELIWYSSMENTAAFETPDIGSGGSDGSATFTTGKYGNAIQVDADDEEPYFPSSSNISGTAGVVEFWFKETGTPAATGAFFACDNGSGTINMELARGGNDTDIDFTIDDGSSHVNSWDGISVNIYDEGWHHVRLQYDAAIDTPDLYLDGIQQTRDATSAWSAITPQTNTYIGDVSSSDRNIGGQIDEMRIYSPLTGSADTLAHGGNNSSSNEFLYSNDRDYTLDFEAVDANSRGEYTFFGSDSMFSGINVDLDTVGVSGSAPVGLFNINHEGGNLEEYDSTVTDSGDLSVTSAAALANTEQGMSVNIDDTTAIYGLKSFTNPASNEIRFRFYIDPNNLTMGSYDEFYILTLADSGGTAVLEIHLYDDGASNWSILTWVAEDDWGWSSLGVQNITDAEHYVEVYLIGATGTGSATQWIDGEAAGSATSLDNDTRFDEIVQVRFGAVDSLDAGTSGTFYLDELKINSDGSEIGVWAAEPVDIDWEYWNGNSWASLESITGFTDDTGNLTQNGSVYWTANPTNWRPFSLNGSTDLYYIRVHLESGSYTTYPIENLITTDILTFQYTRYDGTISSINQTFEIPGYTSNSSPILYWALDEGYGTTTNDTSNHNNPGTITNASWTEESLCVSGKCLHFDGDGDYISRADDAELDFDENRGSTIMGWFRHGPISSSADVLVEKYESTGTDGGYRIQMESDGDISFGIDDANGDYADDTVTSTSADYDDNGWHHFAAVKDDTTDIKLYLDGHLINTDSSIGSTGTLENNDTFYVGIAGDGASNDFDGFIDEIKVYRFAKSADEIKADFVKGSSTKGSSTVLGTKDYSYLSEGLVGYWKMDETSGNPTDSSGNGTTLTNQDSTAYTGAKFGNGAEPDGSADYFDAADNTALSVTGDLTLSAWIEPDDVTSHSDHIIGKFDEADESYQLIKVDDEIRMYIDSSSDYGTTDAANLAADTMYHVAGVYNSTGQTVKLFVNGELEASTTTGTIPGSIGDDAGEFSVGAEDTGGTPANYFDGHIDEVRVYNRALSPSEIRQLADWAPGPVGWWKMDEAAGTRYDSSSNGNNLSETNTVEAVTGKYSKATNFEFDDTNDELRISDGDQNGLDFTGPMSLMAWVKPESLVWRYGTVISKESSSSASYYFMAEGNGYNRVRARLSSDGTWDTPGYVYSDNNTISLDTWYHIAMVYDGSYIRLYIDGVEQTGGNVPYSYSGPVWDGTGEFQVGNTYESSSRFDGIIDDVRVYNYGRTSEQIIEDMNAGHPAPGSPVGSAIGEWHFDETFGTTANDSTENNNDLTLSAASWTTSGKFGSAYNGADNTRLSRSDDADFDFAASDTMTITGWFARSTISNNEYLVYKENGNEGYTVYIDSTGDVIFGIGDTSSSSFPEESIGNVGTDYDNGSWHHFAAIKNGTTGIYLYVDGVLIASDTSLAVDATLENSGTLYIGDANATDGTDEFLGDIDETKIFRLAMTSDQVKTDYNMGKAQVLGYTGTDSSDNPTYSATNEYCPPGQGSACTAPVAHWKLDENSGTTSVYDISGNGYTGTMAGTMTESDWIPGKIGSALEFDGSDDHITTNYTGILSNNPRSVTAWIKTSSGTDQGIVSWGDSDLLAGEKIDFRLDEETGIGWTLRVGVNGPGHVRGSTKLDDGLWHHVAFTFPGGTSDNVTDINLYVDGMLETIANSASQTINTTTDQNVDIGEAVAGNRRFNGIIDDVRIYDYERTPAQIAWEYNRGKPISWWKLDECTGTVAYDSSISATGTGSNGNDGTITIGATGTNTSAGTCSSGAGDEAWDNGTTGKRGASLDFDGADDYISVTNASEIDFDESLQNGVTISAWIYADSDGESDVGRIFTKNTNTWCRTDNQSGSNLDIECSLDLSTDATLNIPSAITTGFWNYVAIGWTDDGDDEITIWINGANRGTSSDGVGPVSADTANLIIGNDSTSHNYTFDGDIDEFKIFNYELTGQQIRNEYNSGAVRFGP